MKQRLFLIFLSGMATILVVLGILFVSHDTDAPNELVVSETVRQESAPVSSPTVKQPTLIANTQNASASPFLHYDPDLSFRENLMLLKNFCLTHGKSAEGLIDPFVQEMLRLARHHKDVILEEIYSSEGDARYRVLLLAGLAQSHGPEITEVIWNVALDGQEYAEVRQTAAFLLKDHSGQESRPDRMNQLLRESNDPQLLLFSLQSAPLHGDEETYEIVSHHAELADDLHVRIAAVNAMASMPFTGSQEKFRQLATNLNTTKENPFSDESLVKSSLIVNMNPAVPENEALLIETAQNSQEEDRVRSKAIQTLVAKSAANREDFLLQILEDTIPDNNPLVIYETIGSLMKHPTPRGISAVMEVLDSLEDPQFRDLILHTHKEQLQAYYHEN